MARGKSSRQAEPGQDSATKAAAVGYRPVLIAPASALHANDHDTDHASGAHDSGAHDSADGGHGAHDEIELDAFDVVAWTFGAAGVVIGLIMWACFAISTAPL